MSELKTILTRLKPAVPKRALLFIAGLVWSFAGGMLLYRGILMLAGNTEFLYVKLILCLVLGSLFYCFLFNKISYKHTKRIKSLSDECPCAFSFFNWKGYLMMAVMILLGVSLRATGVVPLKYLSLLYITMGVPLSISAIRFYINGLSVEKSK